MIGCPKCGININSHYHKDPIKLWNTRPQDEEIRVLKKEVDHLKICLNETSSRC